MAKHAHDDERRHSLHADHHDLLLDGLRHIGWSQFVDAMPGALGPHQHEGAYEVCYIKRGSVTWWVGEETFSVAPGELFMTRPDELHGGEGGVMDRCELYWVSFVLDRERGSLGLRPAEAAAIDAALLGSGRRICAGSDSLVQHYQRLLDAVRDPDDLAAMVVRSTMALFLHEVVAAYRAQDEREMPERRYSERTRRAIDWMHEHSDELASLDLAAAHVDLRPSQFRKVFRDETGFTPQEYLTQIRLQKAKALLADRRLTVTEIALKTGFNSGQYFSTAFKKLTGFSPNAYRRRGDS